MWTLKFSAGNNFSLLTRHYVLSIFHFTNWTGHTQFNDFQHLEEDNSRRAGEIIGWTFSNFDETMSSEELLFPALELLRYITDWLTLIFSVTNSICFGIKF